MRRVTTGGLAGLLIGLIVAIQIPPRAEAMAEAGENLIPDGATDVEFGAASGHPIIVGHRQFAAGWWEDPQRSPEDLYSAVLARAAADEWSLEREWQSDFGLGADLESMFMLADLSIHSLMWQGRPIDGAGGRLTIERNEAILVPLFWGTVALGGVAGAAAGAGWPAIRTAARTLRHRMRGSIGTS